MTAKRHSAAGCRAGRLSLRLGGFSLVEVLVSLIVIAVGMLGLAKIQALAFASTGVASQRSLAAVEAASLASAMRANRNYWSNVTTPFTFTTTAGVPASSPDATLINPYNCDFGGADAPCTAPNKLAAYDLNKWSTALDAVLPKPTGTIACPVPVSAGQPVGCSITVNWVEENVAINTQSLGNSLAAPTYTLYVVP